jgi:hypothetical protein
MHSLDFDNFSITSVSGGVRPKDAPPVPNPLGPLALLAGTWKGTGFNQIWRPLSGPQDRFLELNETTEVLQFVEIPGDIPNRGLLQADIELHGLTYLQKINDAHVLQNGKPAGIHIEPGIWISVPATTNPQDPGTVARMANIPHGTSLLAQGTAFTVPSGPKFASANITPFPIGGLPGNPFPEQKLSVATAFRTPLTDVPNVTQAIVDNPNSVLQAGIAGKTITSTTVLKISTMDLNPPTSGGGTSNIAFLQGTGGKPNANAVQMDATFWIEELAGDGRGDDQRGRLQLQYTQLVVLNFNGLSWPHVSVATLVKEDEHD